ncbi:MAG: hypothetical protein HKN71_01530 [Gemmatimonadetes bacterium]|nr:hypothetical protein [Gemmatimonadota bacterium]
MPADPGAVAGVLKKAKDASMASDRGQAAPVDSGAFDVWTHTAAAAEPRPGEAQATAEALADAPARSWERADGGAVADSAAMQASEALAQMELMAGLREPAEGETAPEGALGHLGATFDVLTRIEQIVSAPLAALPFPAFPALRVLDMDIGLPHAHTHPPNLVPPAPPVPFPSTGPVIPIPFLSGATRTLINAMPAARCGDMGLGVWCGGYFPMYEVFLGSSSVWIEGSRAGRLLVDITRHCMFTVPKPTDPPVGPMVGMTITASPNVLIGGVPMPSLLDLAMGKVMEALFKGVSKLAKRLKAARKSGDDLADLIPAHAQVDEFAREVWEKIPMRPSWKAQWERLKNAKHCRGSDAAAQRAWTHGKKKVDQLIRSGRIEIDTLDYDLERLVREDLYLVAANPVGYETIDRLARTPGRKVSITPKVNSKAVCSNTGDGMMRGGKPGPGCDSTVVYDPHKMGPGSPPDSTLHHELVHSANGAEGVATSAKIGPDGKALRDANGNHVPVPPDPLPQNPDFPASEADRQARASKIWTDHEEQLVITQHDNPYRDYYNLPARWGHRFSP